MALPLLPFARLAGWTVLAGAAAALAAACGATNDATFTSSSGSGGAGHSSGSASGGLGGGFSTTGSAGAGTSIGGGCAGTSVKAEKTPLDMYIMFDQSGSMGDPAGNTTKWVAVTGALSTFVQQPQTNGLGVGLQYFPLSTGGQVCQITCMKDADCGAPACGPCFGAVMNIPGVCLGGASGSDSCNPADYANPEIPIAALPGVANSIIQSLGMHGPTTNTPTSAALQGAIDYAKTWSTMNPTHVVIAVLATDGEPTECDQDLNAIDAIAAAGANGMPKILTFVIGVGTSLSNLNGIAAAGGTGQAFLVDTNANASQQFLDALNQIQGKVLACQYAIPQPMMGEPDYSSVNVQYTPGDGSMPQIFPKVDDKAHCPPNGDAWYYDNNASPTQIIMCDSTCTKISADTMGEVDIVLGCTTIVP